MAATRRRGRRALLARAASSLAIAASAPAAAPSYTDWSAPVNLGPVDQLGDADESGPALSAGRPEPLLRLRPAGRLGGRDIWVSHAPTRERRLGSAGEPRADDQLAVERRTSRRSRRTATGCSSPATAPAGSAASTSTQSCRAGRPRRLRLAGARRTSARTSTRAASDNGAELLRERRGARSSSSAATGPGGSASATSVRERAPGGRDLGPADAGCRSSAASSPRRRPTIRHDGLEIFFYCGIAPGRVGHRPVGRDAGLRRRALVDAGQPRPGREQPASSTLHPYLSADGRTLFFASNRPGGSASVDLYMTTRSREADGDGERPEPAVRAGEPAADLRARRVRRRRDGGGRVGDGGVLDDGDAVEPGRGLPDHVHGRLAERAGLRVRLVRRRHAHGRATRVRA